MNTGTKILMAVTGILLIALGVVCICNPAATLFTTAWVIGILTLCSGIFEFIFCLRTQRFLPNSGSVMLSAILQIVIGLVFLAHNVVLTVSLPVIFAIWVIIEGIILAIRSFDFKKVGFSSWWAVLLLGIGGAALGFLGLRHLDVTAATLSTLIGIGVIANGAAYLVALSGISRFEKKVEKIKEAAGL